MPDQITNYQCPACTGPLHFSGESGRLECEYCGSSFDIADIEAMYAEKDAAAASAAEDAEKKEASGEESWGTEDGMRAYLCPSCGAEIVCDETTAATSCPYCGNPSVVPGQLSGMKKPDLVIPFRLSKKDAVEALRKFYKGKVFLPKAFADENHLEEVKGVYVPFWLYDVSSAGDADFEATRVHVHENSRERVTVTEYFLVKRRGKLRFEKIPADGSTKMPDGHMDAIEPFDYSELKPFSSAYLPGFYADKYDVTKEQNAGRIRSRVEFSTEAELRGTVIGYTGCTTLRCETDCREEAVKYAMLPVWMLNTKWKDQTYLFAMNGQTGKLVGNLPVDMGRFFALLAAIAVPAAAIISLLLSL